ncbi:MAG: CheR family methyltransferase [Filomicrobium sp.]
MSTDGRPSRKPRKAAAGKSPRKRAVKKRNSQPETVEEDLDTAPSRNTKSVPIVALGASAGGLEPLEQFFKNMPSSSGLAFVVVQHLSPDFRSMMDELLARYSSMSIERAEDGMAIRPNTVYLNPPRQEMIIQGNKLCLIEERSQLAPSLPINSFMESLAAEAGQKAIGIILSGTGSDGTKGVDAIRRAGGTVIVQEPNSAKFDGMPRSALASGPVTATALPSEMAALVLRAAEGESIDDINDVKDEIVIGDPHREILRMLQHTYGSDFNYYKLATVDRRINRRALMNGFNDIGGYSKYIKTNAKELEQLYCDLLIGVTAFFRDKDVFDRLRDEIIPKVCEKMSEEQPVRIWIAGCASGEEAYSFAILVSEYARKKGIPLHAKIFASDIHFRSLEIATNGEYFSEELQNIPSEIVSRYFEKSQTIYRVRQSIRSLVVFSRHNLIKDPPFTRMDLIACRNLLIYLNEVAQRKALAIMHFALIKRGVLLLGPSESTGELSDEFEPINNKARLYRKKRDITLQESTRILPPTNIEENTREQNTKDILFSRRNTQLPTHRKSIQRAYDTLLEAYAPPGIVTDREGEILHIFGNGLDYIELKSGAYSSRLPDVVKEPFRPVLSVALERIRNAKIKRFRRSVRVSGEGAGDTKLVMSIEPLPREGTTIDCLLVTFEPLVEEPSRPNENETPLNLEPALGRADSDVLGHRLQELERDLQFTEESLQSTIEELETSNEELQATNEELMSANEELQSTNEELHSVNEELYTVSTEHQRKIDQLTEVTNDMEHLLRSTDVGVLFLDQQLCIRRFTPTIARSFNLLDRDVGRPIEHVTTRFNYEGFVEDVHAVLRTAKPKEMEVVVDDLSYLLRILPYHSPQTSEAAGAVVTLVDITRLKDTERALGARNAELNRMNENLEQFTYIVSHDLRAPLRAIRNSAQWMEEDAEDKFSEDLQNHLTRLRSQAARLSDMLRDLLQYSKLGSEEQALERIDMERLVRDILPLIEYDTEINIDTGRGLPTIITHRPPMHLVFLNLLDNAAKYSGRRKTDISIKHRKFKGHHVFVFSDNGPGISQEKHDQIFLPFRKLERPTDQPGTGMGLALVRKAIETHQGRIKVKSFPGDATTGTKFIFSWKDQSELSA